MKTTVAKRTRPVGCSD